MLCTVMERSVPADLVNGLLIYEFLPIPVAGTYIINGLKTLSAGRVQYSIVDSKPSVSTKPDLGQTKP